jgi:hypothetical protein
MGKLNFELVWFDSFGAKSSCTKVITPDLKLLIDPGIAIMHGSFPASIARKIYWKEKGKAEIIRASKDVNAIVVSHYHWDHFLPRDLRIYAGKLLLAKNPNEYINDSQRKRALNFYSSLWKAYGKELELGKARKKRFENIAHELASVKLDFGDYTKRRRELLRKGRRWFSRRRKRWLRYELIPEVELDGLKVVYPEGKEFRFGATKLRFTTPLFHGIEYSRVGWVFATIVEVGREKLIHSSDLNGPIVEDYADMLIEENPTYLILDGPMTYMLGYTLNRINLRRVLKNVKKIIERVDFKLMVWDHHLPREARFRERTRDVWSLAKELGKELVVASEFQLGRSAVVEALGP